MRASFCLFCGNGGQLPRQMETPCKLPDTGHYCAPGVCLTVYTLATALPTEWVVWRGCGTFGTVSPSSVVFYNSLRICVDGGQKTDTVHNLPNALHWVTACQLVSGYCLRGPHRRTCWMCFDLRGEVFTMRRTTLKVKKCRAPSGCCLAWQSRASVLDGHLDRTTA